MDEVATAEFEGRDFDARELVMKYRRRMPLSQLQKSLSSHKTAIRQELIELINEKYSDFVSLSSRMQGVEQALRPLRTPLEESRGLAGSFKDRLGELLAQSDAKFQELADVSARRRQVAAYIENAKLLQKTKDATASQWANPQEAGDFLRAYTAHENIARDLQRIRLNLSVGETQETTATPEGEAALSSTSNKPPDFKPLPRGAIVAEPESSPPPKEGSQATPASEAQAPAKAGPCGALLDETKSFEATFVEKLQEQLLSLLEAVKRGWDAAEDPSQRESQLRTELLATASTCRALVTLERNSVIETAFVKVFVKSTLDAATTACVAAAGSAGADDPQKRQAGAAQGIGTTDLTPFFKVISESLLAQDSALMWVARRLHSQDDPSAAPFAVPSMHLLTDAVVAPVLGHVQTTWPNIFMPAFPDIFVTNYSQAQQFLSSAEALMLPSERRWLKGSAALLDFRKKWKTQVYFSLRSKEMAQRLDAVINAGDGQNFEQKYVYDGRVFWLRTSVEVVRQLRHIWSDRVYLDVLFPKALRLTLEILGRYSVFIKGISESADNSSEASAGPTGVGAKVPHIISDVLGVLSEVRVTEGSDGRATKLILGRLPKEEDGGMTSEEIARLEAAAREALKESAVVMQGPIDAFEAVLIKQIASTIAPQFAAIRGIPAVYRMTNKPVPTRASPYVESALKPVINFYESSSAVVAPEVISAWIVRVVDAASDNFITQAQQLLEQVQQQEASLARLQKRDTASDAVNVTDANKIHIQLCLDVEVFTKQCQAAPLNVAPGSSQGLKKLREAVDSVWAVFEQHREK